jgi:hypothetical protein
MLAGFQMHRWSASQAAAELSSFLDERWKGQGFIHQGNQVEQLDLSQELYGADPPACVTSGAQDGQ